jgi:monoamine oxidase
VILCAVIADLASAYELRKTDYEYVILEAGAHT